MDMRVGFASSRTIGVVWVLHARPIDPYTHKPRELLSRRPETRACRVKRDGGVCMPMRSDDRDHDQYGRMQVLAPGKSRVSGE